MRILHISANQYPSLDSEHHTKRIWKELAKGVEQYHILARARDNSFHLYQEGNIYLHLIPAVTKRQWVFFFSSFYLIVIIGKYRIDKLLVQCPIMGGFAAAVYKSIRNISFMVELHGEEYFRYFSERGFRYCILSKIQSFTFRQASVIRSLSPKMSEKLAKYGVVDKVEIIPNRVDLNLFRKRKSDFKISGRPTIVSVGRFVEAKNYTTLIRFCLDNDYKLILIGGGRLKTSYSKMIPIERSGDVRLIDWVDQSEMIDTIVSSDIYIQSSVTEGVPRTILEAMALNMPVISTRVGSIEGILRDGENSLLIQNPMDLKEYQVVVTKLLSSEKLREGLSHAAYSDVVENYEWNKVFNLYRKVLYSL